MSVVTLTGNNSYLIDQTIKEMVGSSLKDNGPDSVERIDAEGMEADDVLSRFNAVSLFAEKSLLLIRGMSGNKELSEKFTELLDDRQPDNDLVLIEPKLDKRSKLYSALKKKSLLRELNTPMAGQLSAWVAGRVKEKGGSISTRDAAYLVERAGANQELLANEIDKLLLFNPKVSQDTIDQLVEPSPQSTVFNLINAALTHDFKRVIKLYAEQQALKVDPRQIIGSLAWQLHIIALVKQGGGRSLSDIAGQSGINPNQLDSAKKLAANISFDHLVNAINRLLEIDVKSKSKAIDTDGALLYFLLSL